MTKKNKWGRPSLWTDPEELQVEIDKYFLSLWVDEEGRYKRPPTITGLALALWTNRQTLINYEDDDEFFYTIKEAKLKCEQRVEENAMLWKANTAFAIFSMKNNYWRKDKTETDLNVEWKLEWIKIYLDE